MWYRVNEILSLTNKEEWVYCLTGENPADLGPRGALVSQLGPQWLIKKREDWPVTTEQLQTPESLLEQKQPTSALLVEARSEVGVAAVINLSEHSKLHKLVRVVTWVR